MILATAILALLTACLWWLLARTRPRPEPDIGPAGDPYAADVAEFRRQIHDWTRGA